MPASKADWLAELRSLIACTERPCILVECPKNFYDNDLRSAAEFAHEARSGPLREKVVCGNEAWYQLCEYGESDVAGRPFSEIPGFQGGLTSEESKLKMGSLLITEARMVEDIKVVNYTGRSRTALEICMRVDIYKQSGRNAFFICSIMDHREAEGAVPVAVAGGNSAAPHGFSANAQDASYEPEPELSPQTEWQEWQLNLVELLEANPQPCVLVACQKNISEESERGAGGCREHIVCGNASWYDLYQLSEDDVANRPFSQVRGFQGELTSEESKLQFASLLITEQRVVDGLAIVNYCPQSGRAIEATMRVEIFKKAGRNCAFLCTVTQHRTPRGAGSPVHAAASEELESGGWSRQTTPESGAWLQTGSFSRQTTSASQGDLPEAEGPLHRQKSSGWASGVSETP